MNLPLLSVLGGLLALDGTSVGQFMVSRPFVAGALTGWVVGDPILGLLVGGVLEVYLISVFPVGGANFPEGGPSTLVGVVAASQMGGPGGLALGVLLGLVWSQLAGMSVKVLRRVNERLAPDPTASNTTPLRVVTGHLGGIGIDFSRGLLLTVLGLIVGGGMVSLFAGTWPLGRTATLGLLAVGASVPAGAFVASLGGWKRRSAVFAAGFLAALVGGLLL